MPWRAWMWAIALSRSRSDGRALELELGAGVPHLALQPRLHLVRLAGEELAHLGHDPGVLFPAYPADAGRRAALDLVLQARPGTRAEDAVAAAAQRERLEQRVQRVVDRTGRCERPEILGLRALGAAMLADQRELVAVAQGDVGEALVVAQDDVERRPVALDQVGLEQQRLDLAGRRDELHRPGEGDHALQPGRQHLRLGVGGHALA